MSAEVDRGDLLWAFDFVNVGAGLGNEAYVSRTTGKIYFKSDDLDDVGELPENLETSSDYVSLPSKKELDLGRDVVFSFVEESMPDEWDTVRGYLSRAGAYGRFKDQLGTRGKL
jgi:hypothetical protein